MILGCYYSNGVAYLVTDKYVFFAGSHVFGYHLFGHDLHVTIKNIGNAYRIEAFEEMWNSDKNLDDDRRFVYYHEMIRISKLP